MSVIHRRALLAGAATLATAVAAPWRPAIAQVP
jgi:hypothetical protein